MQVIKALPLLGIAMLTGWIYAEFGNVLILLTSAWFSVLFLASAFAPSKYGSSFESELYRQTGFLSPGELVVVMFVMAIFSFVAYFIVQSHWFLLAHGAWWGLATTSRMFGRNPRRV